MNKTVIRNMIIWTLISVYLILVLGLVASQYKDLTCEKVEIVILDEEKNNFVTPGDVMDLLQNNSYNLVGKHLDSINLAYAENLINAHPAIKHAQVYQTIGGTVKIEIRQRSPILRIITQHGESFFIDREGFLIPQTGTRSPHILLANGNLDFDIETQTQFNVNFFENDSNQTKQLLFDLYQMANYVVADEFYNALIEQIYITKDKQLEIVPKIGTHIVAFGESRYYKEKLRKLKILYKEGFVFEGWTDYQRVDLRYKGQVVCKKK